MNTIVRSLLAISLLASSASALARPFDEIKRSGKIVAATEGQFPPFNFFEGSKLTGFEVDLGNELGKNMGVAVEWKTMAFDSLLIGLGQNRYDFVIASHGVTPERAKAVLFTNPHYCTGGVIVSRNAPLTRADLSKKTVAVQVGTTYLSALQKEHLYKELRTLPKDTDALQSLLSQKVDAWVSDRFVALETAAKHPELKVGELVFTEKVAMAVPLANTSLQKALNDALAATRANGSFQKLSERYFKTDVSCRD